MAKRKHHYQITQHTFARHQPMAIAVQTKNIQKDTSYVQKVFPTNTNPNINKINRKSKCSRPLLIIILLFLSKIKYFIYHQFSIYKTELFFLKLIFCYFLYQSHIYIYPRILDLQYLQIPIYEQLQLLLYNNGIYKQSQSTLNLNHLSSLNVVFVAVLNNAETNLNEILHSLQIFGCSFNSAHYIFLVNEHSTDHSSDIIQQWNKNRMNISCNEFHSNLNNNWFGHGFGDRNNQRSFHKNGKLTAEIYALSKPLEEFLRFEEYAISKKERHTIGENHEKIYNNFIFDRAFHLYEKYESKGKKLHKLFWIGNQIHNIEVQSIANEFYDAWKEGYNIVCANGIKYGGWYFDSGTSVLLNNTWFRGKSRFSITNYVRSEKFIAMKSCFNGFIAYDMELLYKKKCKFLTFKESMEKYPLFAQFINDAKVGRINFRVPYHFCLHEKGMETKMVIASRAFSFLGTNKASWSVQRV